MRIVEEKVKKQEVEILLVPGDWIRTIFVSGLGAGCPCRAGGGSVC